MLKFGTILHQGTPKRRCDRTDSEGIAMVLWSHDLEDDAPPPIGISSTFYRLVTRGRLVILRPVKIGPNPDPFWGIGKIGDFKYVEGESGWHLPPEGETA